MKSGDFKEFILARSLLEQQALAKSKAKNLNESDDDDEESGEDEEGNPITAHGRWDKEHETGRKSTLPRDPRAAKINGILGELSDAAHGETDNDDGDGDGDNYVDSEYRPKDWDYYPISRTVMWVTEEWPDMDDVCQWIVSALAKEGIKDVRVVVCPRDHDLGGINVGKDAIEDGAVADYNPPGHKRYNELVLNK